MSGIYGIYSSKMNIPSLNNNKFFSSTYSNVINEEKQYECFTYGRSVINKFLNDRILFENKQYIIAFEGLYFNKNTTNVVDTIITLYEKQGINFVKDINGLFSGFIFNKTTNELSIFNDHLATRQIYYYFNKEQSLFIFASEMKMITKLLKELSLNYSLDLDGAYSLLNFGCMLYDHTIVDEIKRLDYSTILQFNCNDFSLSFDKHFNYTKEKNNKINKNDILNTIDELLIKSVKRQWNKDSEYNYNHYALLSGGLDSRVNILLAKELGFEKILTYTFSQSNTLDQHIAQEIANDNHFEHLFYAMDNGNYLINNISDYINLNDGIVYYSGSAHMYSAMSQLDNYKYGSIHKGQIGDGLFGSLIKKNFTSLYSNAINKDFLNKLSFIDKLNDQYNNQKNYELFSFEQKIINAIMINQNSLANFTDITSPFFDKELISFCLTIPDHYKINEAIYIDWINSKHPNISKYKWEKIAAKPSNQFKVAIFKKHKLYKNAILKRLGFKYSSMNPFKLWLDTNPKLLKNLDYQFNNYIENIPNNELKKDLLSLYNNDNVNYSNKFLPLTLLLAYDLHFS